MAEAPRVTSLVAGQTTYILFYRPGDIIEAERLLDENMEQTLRERGFRRLAIYLYAGIRHSNRQANAQFGQRMLEQAMAQGLTYLNLWAAVIKALTESNILRTDEDESPIPNNDPGSAATDERSFSVRPTLSAVPGGVTAPRPPEA